MSEDRPLFPPRKFASQKVIIGPINSNNPNVRQFVHPNYPWNNWVKLNLSNHPKNFLPTQTIKDNLQNIEKLKDCVACLLISYKDETHTFATAFRVAPRTFVTAKHHLLPSETLIPSSVQSIFLANVPAVPYYDRDVDLDNYKFIKAEVISLNDEERTTLIKEGKDPHKCTIKDIDPISLMEKDLIGDFLIIKTVEDVGDENAYLTPYYDEIKDDSQVAVLGYNLPVGQDLDRMYDQTEDFVIDQHKIQRVFLGYNWKSLSPGFVAKSNDRLLAHTCSTTPGSSGSACVLIDNFTNGKMYFIGIHIGSRTKTQTKSNNYNMATSVRHPLFVEQYKKFVELELF